MSEYLTSVDIGNRALQILGVPRIYSFTDASLASNEIGFAYDKLRVTELEEHLWKFAIVSTTLTVSTTVTFTDGVTKNLFPYPTGYLRMADQDARQQGTNLQRTSGGVQYSDFQLVQAGILTSLAALPTFWYVEDVTNVALFDTHFYETLAARIAMGVAPLLAPERATYAFQLHEQALTNSMKHDAIEVGNMEPIDPMVRTERLNIMMAPPARGPNG